jgi:hypothetical protein
MSSPDKRERLRQSVATMEHVSEDSLDLYSMGQLPEGKLEIVEEHLLLCETCRSCVEELEGFVRTFRDATPAVWVRPKPEDVKKGGFLHWLLGGSTRWRPMYGLAGALAVLLVMVATRPPTPEPGPASEIHLQAMRSSGAVEAEASKPLNLRLDLSLLPPHPAYHVRVADWNGGIVWQSSVLRSGDDVTAAVRDGLNPGRYWVRIYSGGTLLREYSLRVR